MTAYVPVPCIYVKSQQGGEIAQFLIPNTNDLMYEYAIKKKLKDGTINYICCECRTIQELDKRGGGRTYGTPSMAKVAAGAFITDPMNPIHPHYCIPRNAPVAVARRDVIAICHQMRNAVVPETRGPLELKHALVQNMTNNNDPNKALFGNAEKYMYVESIKVGPQGHQDNIRRTFQRNKSRNRNVAPIVLGQLDPSLFRCPVDGESFCLKDDGTVVYVASDMLLQQTFIYLQPKTLIGDGRYKGVPIEFHGRRSCQIYTVMVEVQNGHCYPILTGFLKESTQAAYDHMFRCFNDKMRTLGLLAALANIPFLVDFEAAAIASIKQELGMNVLGCFFHYQKRVNARRDMLGLKAAGLKNHAIKQYHRRIQMLPLIPMNLLGHSGILDYPRVPIVTIAEEAALAQFADYLSRTWIGLGQFADVVNISHHTGIRTTNFCEGHHNKVSAFFKHKGRVRMEDALHFVSIELCLAKGLIVSILGGRVGVRYLPFKELRRQTDVNTLISDFQQLTARVAPFLPTRGSILTFLDSVSEKLLV